MKHAKRRICYALAGLLIMLVAFRLYLPYAAANYINSTLSQSKNYDGRVGDVDLMLWRGAYSLEHVLLYKANGQVDRPLFKADYVEFTLSWSQLFKGAAVGRVVVNSPEINFVDGNTEEESQSGKNENWLYIANQLFPLRIDKLAINQGKVAFHNPDTTPAIDIALHDIQLEINNLVNSDNLSDSRVATAKAKGQTAEQGTISLNAKLNPSTKAPTFDIDIQADNVGLVNFKNLLDTYAPFDLEAGTLTLAAEVASNEGKVKGYIKPILHNVEVFSWKGDIVRDGDGFFEGSVEAISAFITELFENQSEDQIATRIPIEGDLSSPETQTWDAFIAILKNAFVQAFKGNVEESIELDRLEDVKGAKS
ncbi:DUF748 domain-containing protein [Alteromonas gracilis]|uniref:DUF748 domain-containing protein n=1 Tax=Alteromonas gracilis TaxID=1479524 RepID=UPI00373532D1